MRLTRVDLIDLYAGSRNQPTLEGEVADYFRTRKLKRDTAASRCEPTPLHQMLTGSSRQGVTLGEARFTNIRTLVKVFSRVAYADRRTFETHLYISSAPLDIDRLADGARNHWGAESMHWMLDVEFKDDLSRYRSSHGAKNMAIVRRFALGLVRCQQVQAKRQNTQKVSQVGTRLTCSNCCSLNKRQPGIRAVSKRLRQRGLKGGYVDSGIRRYLPMVFPIAFFWEDSQHKILS
jgi:predicted transposase YbfD/YdcC